MYNGHIFYYEDGEKYGNIEIVSNHNDNIILKDTKENKMYLIRKSYPHEVEIETYKLEAEPKKYIYKEEGLNVYGRREF